MTSEMTETIYEAIGEVTPIENGNTTIAIEEGTRLDRENVSNKQMLFNQGMTDEAVVDCIFNSCDIEKSGLVKASVLVEFLQNACGNINMKQAFQELLAYLDPTVEDPPVTIETFQSALKSWIEEFTANVEESDNQLDLSTLKIQLDQSVSRDSSFSSESPCLDVKELQHQNSRLQEENKLLQEQMADVEESNISLKNENSKLKSKINKVELDVNNLNQQSELWQENSAQLHNHLQQLKDDLQKMTMHYNECQSDLTEKNRELDSLQLNSEKEHERSKQLIETIQKLEEMIAIKEEELNAKDKEIQRIAQDLLEHQLVTDSKLHDHGDFRGHEVEENNLAAELQSSFASYSRKKQTERGTKPDFIHTAAWNVFLNEPEFEEESVHSSVLNHSKNNDAHSTGFDESVIRQADRIVGTVSPLSPERSNTGEANSPAPFDIVHSTPFSSRVSPKLADSIKDNFTVSENPMSALKYSAKHLFWILLYVSCLCAIIGLIAVVVALLLLSASTGSDCNSIASSHYPATSKYYQSSLWSKVFEILKPYCRIEYHGYPPV